MSARRLFYECIQGSKNRAIVPIKRVFICHSRELINPIIRDHFRVMHGSKGVYLSAVALKHVHDRHIFDKKSPAHFFMLIENLSRIIGYPDRIYANTGNKKGDLIFVKKIQGQLCLVSLQIILEKEAKGMEIVSMFVTGKKYLEKFTLLWGWGMASSPS